MFKHVSVLQQGTIPHLHSGCKWWKASKVKYATLSADNNNLAHSEATEIFKFLLSQELINFGDVYWITSLSQLIEQAKDRSRQIILNNHLTKQWLVCLCSIVLGLTPRKSGKDFVKQGHNLTRFSRSFYALQITLHFILPEHNVHS